MSAMAEGVAAAQPMIRLTDLRFRYPDGDFELVIPELRVSWFDSAAGAYRFESAPPLALRVDSPRSEATDGPGETRR